MALWDMSRHTKYIRTDVDDSVGGPGSKPDKDPRRRVACTARSSIDLGHRVCITDLTWLPPSLEVSGRMARC